MPSIQTHFNLSAADYDALRQGAIAQRRADLLRQTLQSLQPQPRRVAEIGCGTGSLLAKLAAERPEMEFTGIDVQAGMIEFARRNFTQANLRYELIDIAQAEAAPAADFLFSIDVIHHVHELSGFFRGVRRMLPLGAIWLAIEPNIYHPYIYYTQERMRRAGFDEDHFRPWVAERLWPAAGFAVASRSYVSIFPACVGRLPLVLGRLERICENWRFLGGSVVYRLRATSEKNALGQNY